VSVVRLYLTDVLWLTGRSYWNAFCTNNKPWVDTASKIWGMQCKGTFSNLGLNGGDRKNKRLRRYGKLIK